MKRPRDSFFGGELLKEILMLGIPVMLQNLVNVLVNMLDTIMIGQLGEAQLGAVNQVNVLYMFYTMFIWGIGIGAVTISSRYWGMGDVDSIRCMTGLAMRINIIAGAVVSAVTLLFPRQVMRFFAADPEVIEYGVEYLSVMAWFYIFPAITNTFLTNLRAVHTVFQSVVIFTISCFTNLCLNWVLIYGNLGAPALGVKGAAIATAISKTLEVIIVLFFMHKIENKLNFRMRYIFADVTPYWKSFLKVGVPVFCSEFFWGVGMTVQGAAMGQYSKEFLAAYSLVMVIMDISTVSMCGFANSSLTIIGNLIGGGKDDEARKISGTMVKGGIAVGVFMALVMIAIRPFAPGFIAASEATREYILKMMLILAYLDVCYGVSWNMDAGILRAGGDTKFLMKVNVGVTAVVKLVIANILGRVLMIDPLYLFLIVCSEDLIKGILFFWRYKKGDWILHNVSAVEAE